MQLAERGVQLNNRLWVRELRKLSKSGHQTAFLSTDYRGHARVWLRRFSVDEAACNHMEGGRRLCRTEPVGDDTRREIRQSSTAQPAERALCARGPAGFLDGKSERDARNRAVTRSKSGRSRHVVLTDEGRHFFGQLVAGRSGDSAIFPKGGRHWHSSEQIRLMVDACKAARIVPAISFHILRHTYASHLIMRDVPMIVVATNLGHADTRMCEKHYGHLAANYVATTIRDRAPTFGIVGSSTVTPMAGG
jgi:hypothetical protein